MSRSVAVLAAILIGVVIGSSMLPAVCALQQERFSPDPREVAPRTPLDSDELATIQLFRDASTAAVFISTSQARRPMFSARTVEVPLGEGSGIVWDEHGHIVTNFHVVRSMIATNGKARVTFNDQTTFDGKLVGYAEEFDLAVLRIDAPADGLHPIRVGTSADLQVGQKVFAIGNPFGWDRTLTTGIVSALDRTMVGVAGNAIEGVIQTDAAINMGNSGGPLLDSAGRLIGINTAIYSPSGASAGIGFAIPVDIVNRTIPQLIAYGKVIRPQLGVVLHEYGTRVAAERGVGGVMIASVREGSSAEEAGLRGVVRTSEGDEWGDVIREINGKPIKNVEDLYYVLGNYKVGDTVDVKFLRGGKREMSAKVRLMPAQ